MTKKLADLIDEIHRENGWYNKEQLVRDYVESVIEECAITAEESYVDNPALAADRIRAIKEQL